MFSFEPFKLILHDDQDQVMAEIFYPDLNSSVTLLEHLLIRPGLDKNAIAEKIIAQFITVITEQHRQIKILDPFAKQIFAAHPEYQTILSE